MGFLGLSFGSKKQTTNQSGTGTTITDMSGTQNQTSSQNQSSTTSSSGSTSQSSLVSGQTTQNQSQAQTGTQRQTGTVTSLGQDVIDALSGATRDVLAGGVNADSIARLTSMIDGRTQFDANSFVNDTVDAARNRGEQQLQEQNSTFQSQVGGSAGTNSMAALLAQRGRNDLESNLAGIRAQAVGQAEQIQNANLGAVLEAQTGIAGIGAALAEAAKGGQTTTDMTSLTDQLSQLIGKDTNLQSSRQSGTSNETSTTNQLLTQIAQLLTSQHTNEKTTENITGTTKSGGFGISLGI